MKNKIYLYLNSSLSIRLLIPIDMKTSPNIRNINDKRLQPLILSLRWKKVFLIFFHTKTFFTFINKFIINTVYNFFLLQLLFILDLFSLIFLNPFIILL